MNNIKSYDEFIEEGFWKNAAVAGLVGVSTLLPGQMKASDFQYQNKNQTEIVTKEDSLTNDNFIFYTKKLKKQGYKISSSGLIPEVFIKGNKNNKEIKQVSAVANTEQSASFQAKNEANFPMRSISYSRILANGNVEVLLFYY